MNITLPFVVSVVLMFLGLGGLLKCNATEEQNWKVKTLSFFLLCVIFALGLAALYYSGIIGSRIRQKDLFIDEYENVRAVVLGKYFAETKQGTRVLVIAGWDDQNKKLVSSQIESLKKGLAPDITVEDVERVDIERNKRNGNPYLSSRVTGLHFDDIINRHEDCDLVISMIGLPSGMEDMKVWRYNEPERPKFAILDASFGEYLEKINSGEITVVTCYRPGWTFSPDIPDDPIKAFEMRYIMITKDNLREVVQKYHWLLRK